MTSPPSTLAPASSAHALVRDLDEILARTRPLWEELRNGRIFMTGGTGFFGCWLLESFLWANEKLDLHAHAVVLTRDRAAFARKASRLAAHSAVELHPGDICDFEFPTQTFSHIIHAATPATRALHEQDPLAITDTIINGTRRVLEFARTRGTKKILFTSSGAVYGRQPADLTHIPETYTGAPDPTDFRSAYGEGKRAAELLCILYARQYGLEPKIARCFAFVGPHLPLNEGYAIGNFLRDALAHQPIHIAGDGTPYRSYLYAADLAAWLWTLLFKAPACRPYNVRAAHAVTIAQTARAVADAFDNKPEIKIAKTPVPGASSERYVPDVTRAKNELNLDAWTDLPEALRRTAAWHRSHPTQTEPNG